MKQTSNYNLKKPEHTDFTLVDDLNDNADTIDAQMKTNADAASAASTAAGKAQTAAEAAQTAVDGMWEVVSTW